VKAIVSFKSIVNNGVNNNNEEENHTDNVLRLRKKSGSRTQREQGVLTHSGMYMISGPLPKWAMR
jgi:hypothetical protein